MGMLSENLTAAGKWRDIDWWHVYCKKKFLGCKEYEMPDGEVIIVPNSSKNLDVGPFADLMTRVEEWAMDHDVWLADREDIT